MGGADTYQVLTSYDTKTRSTAFQWLCSNASSNISRFISGGNLLNRGKLAYKAIVIAAVLNWGRVYISWEYFYQKSWNTWPQFWVFMYCSCTVSVPWGLVTMLFSPYWFCFVSVIFKLRITRVIDSPVYQKTTHTNYAVVLEHRCHATIGLTTPCFLRWLS